MSSYIKRSARRSDDTMDDETDDKDDTKRKSRNLSEKKRRDQFNMLVNELSSMVSSGNRKMDKSTVLKSTIAFLKNHNEIAVRSRAHEIQEDWKPAFLSNEEFTHLILEALDGFIMVFSASGQIFYASESITSLLGYLPSDLLSMTVYDMAYDEEQSALYGALLGPANSDGKVEFSCHLRRGGPHSNRDVSYELVHFVGYFRSDVDCLDADNDRFCGYSGEADTRLVFVGTGRLQTPQLIRDMSVPAAGPDSAGKSNEFTSRHSLEWKFLFLDHRAPPIIGYLPFEVLGTSGYDYYHVDDLDDVVTCHEALMQKGEGTSCFYRFLTKGQQWIWLQTRFYITYHQWNSKPEFIVCTHRVVSYADVMKQSRKGASDNQNSNDRPDALCSGSPEPAPTGGTSPWGTSRSSKQARSGGASVRAPGPPSDCTSMSADSPASRHSMMTQQSSVSRSLRFATTCETSDDNGNVGAPRSRMTNQSSAQSQPRGPTHVQIIPQQQPQAVPAQFLEPPQYVAAIPVQPVLGFSGPMLSPLQVQPDNAGLVLNSPTQARVQAQLQRKHAELQALIGQQQAELRRVSEQLVMARLGILPTHQQQPIVTHTTSLLNVTVPYVCTDGSGVSSTTSSLPGAAISAVQLPIGAAAELIAPAALIAAPQDPVGGAAPLDDTTAFSLTQHQAQMLFASPSAPPQQQQQSSSQQQHK